MSSKKDIPNAFSKEEGTVNMGGIDALVRLALDQSRADERRGLKTGMFVSGYRGSPVGMLDAAFIKNEKALLSRNIHFVDGLNEDLAATAVWWVRCSARARVGADGHSVSSRSRVMARRCGTRWSRRGYITCCF